MLIDAHEFIQLPKGMGAKVAPSLVRLQRYDEIAGNWIDAADLPSLGFCIHRNIEDREFGAGFLAIGHSGRESHCERIGQVVEGRAGVIGTLANHQRKAFGDIFDTNKPKSPVGGQEVDWLVENKIRVWLINNDVWLGFDPVSGIGLQRLEVFIRPGKLDVETMSHNAPLERMVSGANQSVSLPV
jgi:hypothetical protein